MAPFEKDPAVFGALNRLLDEALDRPASERARWLEELPPEHEMLKPRLKSLLARAESPGSPLSTLPKIENEPLARILGDDSSTSGETGETVGPYRLKRLLGKGGMGAVWLAERADGLLQRPVALKLPRRVLSRPELKGRLARERDILASLSHPNIARLYDAGLTEDGQPYLALELIEGQSVDEYVRTHRVDLRGRLEIFLQFARAVAYAHSRLVVHRDIKPSNILVDDDSVVHLLDFGIAKLIEEGEAQTTEMTNLSGLPLTLAYAAPEQVAGGSIGVGTDVYSLGVVLYQLLTGSNPHTLQGDDRRALENAVLDAEPPKPSDVAADPSFRRVMRGDIDIILSKALKKDPQERYPTVNAFVDDVERYLQGRAVLAQPDRPLYRLRKFVARNRLAVGAAATVLLAIVAGAGVALWQARVAVAEKERAEEVKDFIVSVFQDADPYVGGGSGAPTAVEMLKSAEARIRETFQEGSELRIELLSIVGSSLTQLQSYEAASSVLEQAVSEAERTLGPNHPRTLHARVARTEVYRFFGKTEEMKKELDLVVPELERTGASREDLIEAVENQAHLAIDEGRYDDAERAAERALALATELRGERHATTVAMSRLLAVAYRFAGNPLAGRAAEDSYRLNLETYGTNRHPSVIDARASYAISLADRGLPKEAVEHLAEAVDDARSLFGDSSAMVGFFAGRLAYFRLRVGDVRGALTDAETHLNVLTNLAEPGSYTNASTLAGYAGVVLQARRADEALGRFTRAVEELSLLLEPSHELLVNTRLKRALARAHLGKFDEADEELAEIADFFDDEANRLRSRLLYARGVVSRLAGEFARAAAWQEECLEAVRPGPLRDWRRMEALAELGVSQLELGERDRAGESLSQALELFERLHTHTSPARADVLVGLGRVRLMAGDLPEARRLLEEADRFWRAFDPENRWAGEAAFWLARCLEGLGRESDARSALARASKILSRSPLPMDAKLVRLTRD